MYKIEMKSFFILLNVVMVKLSTTCHAELVSASPAKRHFFLLNKIAGKIFPAIYKLCFTKSYTTFFTNSLTELSASTTSLKPIASAANMGVKKPSAAIGMAITL